MGVVKDAWSEKEKRNRNGNEEWVEKLREKVKVQRSERIYDMILSHKRKPAEIHARTVQRLIAISDKGRTRKFGGVVK